MNIHTKPQIVWSTQQGAFIKWAVTGKGSCVLVAVAGAGKTTVLLEAARQMPGQVAICAYNREIGNEIKAKLETMGVDWKKAQAGTVHSFGFKAYKKAFPKAVVSENNSKVRDLFADLFDLMSPEFPYQDAIVALVSMAKQRALGVVTPVEDTQAWIDIIEKYEIADAGEYPAPSIDMLIRAARKLLEASNRQTSIIDFDDMVYLPLVHKVRFWCYDVVIIDEAQDTNPARRALLRAMLKRNGRLIAVGDKSQAIYSFCGADSDSLDEIKRAFNCIEMPLTVSFRCPKAVVSFARQWADHIVAADTAIEGSVETKTLEEILAEPALLNSDAAVICRNTKPLIDLFFMLLRRRIPARIEGRDVGASLKKLATRWSSIKTINALEEKLGDYLEKQRAKLLAKKQESRVQVLEDTVDAIIAICAQCRLEGSSRVDDVVVSIDSMFGDNVTGRLTLSTIHKAKGREWTRVLWLDRAGTCPSPWAESAEAQQQESNLCYVGATRAKVQLIDVTVPPKKKDR